MSSTSRLDSSHRSAIIWRTCCSWAFYHQLCATLTCNHTTRLLESVNEKRVCEILVGFLFFWWLERKVLDFESFAKFDMCIVISIVFETFEIVIDDICVLQGTRIGATSICVIPRFSRQGNNRQASQSSIENHQVSILLEKTCRRSVDRHHSKQPISTTTLENSAGLLPILGGQQYSWYLTAFSRT